MSKAHLYGLTTSGVSVPIVVDSLGNISGGGGSGGQGAAADAGASGWSYAAASGGITNTSDVTLAAAPGALRANYISSLHITNASATATEVVVKSGSTILFRTHAAQNVDKYIAFPRPLVAAGNTALTAACITTATQTYINAQGFIGGLPNEAAQTISVINELVDDLGAYVTDGNGETIWVL
jgi:hypothetical protein